MPIETITVTVQAGSANPQTKTVQINVDPTTGSGTGTVSYVGSNGGADTIKATSTIAGSNLTSNSAFASFQQTNGPVAVLTPQPSGQGLFTYTTANHETFYPIISTVYSGLQFTTTVINQVFATGGYSLPIAGTITDDGNSGEYKHRPPILNQAKTDGTAVSPGTINGTVLSSMNNVAGLYVFKGSFVVAAAGYVTFYSWCDDAWAFYLPASVTRYDGTFNANTGDGGGGSPSTWDGLPLIGTRNTSASGYQATDYVRVHFPAPGIYPFRLWMHNNADDQTYEVFTFTNGLATVPGGYVGGQIFGTVIKPIPLQANPNPTVPAGNLQLNVTQNTPYIQGQTATINVTVTGIHYSTKPYIPIFEGTAGKVFLYNNASSNVYNFPTFNAQPVDKTAASSHIFTLAGSNGSWQGRVSVVYNDAADGNFSLKYGGAGFDANVDLTNLTITAEDIAWFNAPNKSFDTYAVNGGLGGNQAQIEIDYMVKPTVSSVSPTQVTADGGVKNIVVALNKPFSPQQQGANNTGNVVNTPVFTCPGCTVGTPTPNIVAGWLTGYTVPITVPSNSSTTTTSLGMTLTGTLTYLNGSTFTTGSVTYIPTHTIATLTLTGVSFTPPSISAFTVAPKTGTAPSYSIVSGATETLTATVSSAFNNAMTCAFWRQSHGTTTRVNMGNGTLSNSYASGGLFYKVFTFSQADTSWYTTNDLGAQATDTVSSLQSNLYFDSSTYTKVTSGGGGGGGGCPSIEMYISQHAQVGDLQLGMSLTALVGDGVEYLDRALARENAQVAAIDFDTQPCHRLLAANGAEVIVSASTPVPTRQAIIAFKEGVSQDKIAIYANEIFAGMDVITDVGNGPEWSTLVETEALGMRRVGRVNCGGKNFAAGSKPGKYIYTHNLIEVK